MSAFIVSEKCMKHIIYNLFWDHEFKRTDWILKDNGYNTAEDFDRLAIELYQLNREAVKQRYDEPEESDYIAIPERFNWDNGKLDKYQALKSMQCLRYQCNEGNVPETKLYKMLETLIQNWMYYILNQIPEYNNAEWD